MTRAAQGQADRRATPARHDTRPIRGKRILYVDDDKLYRKATSRLLRGAGAICLLAGTHDDAVTLAGGEPELALAILDFHMPDGYVGHLVKRLRLARPVLPLIGTSAAERRDEFARHGVTQFLEKPWQLGDLVRIVELVSAPDSVPAATAIGTQHPGLAADVPQILGCPITPTIDIE